MSVPIHVPAALEPESGRVPLRTTAAGLLVRDGTVVLERRPDTAKIAPGVWDVPGGHLESGETPEEALVRELREEFGVTATRFRLGLVQDEDSARVPVLYRHFVYLVNGWEGEPENREGRAWRWVVAKDLFASGHDPELASLRARLHPLAEFALRHFLQHGWLEL